MAIKSGGNMKVIDPKSAVIGALVALLIFSALGLRPKTDELGYIIGPQINAASRLGHSQLPTHLLISENIDE